MLKNKLTTLALVGALSLGTWSAQAEDSALIRALVKKGILTEQEAVAIKADMQKEASSGKSYKGDEEAPVNKIKIADSIEELELYGDARLRYQWENASDQGSQEDNDRSRFRYRLRLGATAKFMDNFTAGVRLETNSANDSTNNNYGGYFDKTGDEIYVGLAYLQYTNSFPVIDLVDIRVGKHLHPFLISSAFWDTDINPEGISEQFGWGDAKEGFSFTARGGQYIISETDNRVADNEISGNDNDDAALYAAQTEFRYSFSKDQSVAIAPMYLHETGGDLFDEENGGFDGENPDAVLGDLSVLLIPVEYKWKMAGLPWKAYGTYGHNFAADNKANQAFLAGDASAFEEDKDANLFNAGLTVGQNKKKGDWSFGAEYRYLEAFSYTGNLADSDFGKNLLNQQGFVLSAFYNITDNITFGASWLHSNDIDKSIDIDNAVTTESDGNVVDVVQVDLNWKF